MSRFASLVLAGLVTLAGCTDPAMEQRVADLEAQVTTLEGKVEQLESQSTASAGPTASDEEAAGAIATQIQEALQGSDYAKGKTLCAQLLSEHRSTRAGRGMRKVCDELAIIGIDAGELEVDKWYRGQASMSDGKVTMLVFFESWCPHCRREVPKVQATYDKYHAQGLNVIGLTRVTKSSTDEKVEELLSEHDIKYPVAKETGAVANRFNVRGIPAAAVVVDGEVVWRGHPARITDEMIEGWLQG